MTVDDQGTINQTTNTKEYFMPTPISVLNEVLKIDARYPKGIYSLGRNIMYSLQYEQYLQHLITSCGFTEVICKKLYKTYIIEALGIIEALFTCLVKANGKWAKDNFVPVEKKMSAERLQDGKTIKVQTITLEKADVHVKSMNFDAILEKIKKYHLFEINTKAFDVMKNIKDLRNKVHLQDAETSNQTDWNSFCKSDYLWARYILRIIMTNDAFIVDKKYIDIYDFLKLEPDEIKWIRQNPMKTFKAHKKENIKHGQAKNAHSG